MKHLVIAVGIAVGAFVTPTGAQPLSKDIAGRIEAIPIQTLTISDEQFLKGDAYGTLASRRFHCWLERFRTCLRCVGQTI
jgi:hypothetical protein